MSDEADRPELPRRIAVRLSDLPRRYLVLKRALEDFADADEFVAAAAAADPEDVARAYVLERAYEVVENSLSELARYGLTQAGLRDAEAQRPARVDFRALHEVGAISEPQRRLLVILQQRRNELGHEYVDVQARLTWEAAVALRDNLPGLIRAYQTWLESVIRGKS